MLSGKTAVVTGASRGIGRAAALALAARGAQIAAIYANGEAEAEQVCAECAEKYGVTARAYRCDVSDAAQVKQTVQAVKKDFGDIRILVNNAGITRDGLAIAMKEEDYDAVLDINLKGAFLMAKQVLPVLMKKPGGCVINISSVSGLSGNAGQCNYAAAKAGLVGLTKSLAKEYASRGVRCNAVAPGFIGTDMTRDLQGRGLEEKIPLGRMGHPEEIADAVAYLAEAEYVTGEVLRVDGGVAM